MGLEYQNDGEGKKKERPIDRSMTTGLYLLRACEIGIGIDDLRRLTVGMVFDMLTEKANDEFEYPRKATQADFDRL